MTISLPLDAPTGRMTAWPHRVALYSHDTQGLGHIRRNLLVAEALKGGGPTPDVLLVSGALEAHRFALPAGADLLTLPALHKRADGAYGPRSLTTSLDDLVGLRSQTIAAALDAFAPDLLIVDKVPRGFGGELEHALRLLRGRPGVRTVLGLRDVLDDPATTRREWRDQESTAAVRDGFDAVWVYGDPRVFDPVVSYRLPPSVARKVRYTGYLARPPRPSHAAGAALPAAPFVLGLVGGGQDGEALAQSFLRADLPHGLEAVLVTGPYLPADRLSALQALAEARPARHVLPFFRGCEALLERAESVVAMGGYNTTCELLAAGARSLVVPRVRPRQEQLIRAQRFADLGLVDVLHPDDLSAAAIARWVAAPPARRPVDAVDLGGVGRIPQLVAELHAAPAPVREMCRVAS
ncbi:MAG: glycosyltransferase family protein [Egibacteraceae bacterium]